MNRTDKLILLLDSGTSTAVRKTAAKQLADLTVKTFRAPPPPSDGNKDELEPDPSQDIKPAIDEKERVTLEGKVDETDAWSEVLDTISRLLPLLKSRSSETRQAASTALGLLGASLPPFLGSTDAGVEDMVDTEVVDPQALLASGQTLLASAGREYIAKPVGGADKAKRRKAMMGSIGLGEVGWGEDVDQIIGDDEMGGPGEKKEENESTSKEETPSTPQDVFEGLSARQITMLKRKKGDIVAEANK
jgi:TATA-binding protein-associated factor